MTLPSLSFGPERFEDGCGDSVPASHTVYQSQPGGTAGLEAGLGAQSPPELYTVAGE